MSNIQFGTDGWRAVIAQDFTFANVAQVAQATADYWRHESQRSSLESMPACPPVAARDSLPSPFQAGGGKFAGRKREKHPVDDLGCHHLGEATQRTGAKASHQMLKVVVGYDRRFLSDQFARVTAEVFAGNGFEVILTPEPTPTPCVSFAVKNLGAVGGVMITASHNPPHFNGFKLKSHFGGSSSPDECKGVESFLGRNLPASCRTGIKLLDVRPAHFAAIKRLVDFKLIARSRLRVAHDALFGVGAGAFESLLRETNCVVTTLNASHDVMFGGICPEPLPKNYLLGGAQLRKNPHDICLVTDGDSDRIGAMDGRGKPMTNQQVIALLLHHLVRNRGGRGTVTKTFNTTAMVDKMCAAWGLPLTEVGIGFRFIAPELMKPGALFGAEESGSVGFSGHIPERDGLAAGLFLLEMLAMQGGSVNRIYGMLEREFGPHRYGRYDAQYPIEKRAALMSRLTADPPPRLLRSRLTGVDARDGVKFVADDSTWLMLRGSGTEPVLRIYAEGKSDEDRERLLKLGVSLLRD